MNRTCDLRFRKPLLYPLSYGGGDGAKCGAKFADTSCAIWLQVTSAHLMAKANRTKIPIYDSPARRKPSGQGLKTYERITRALHRPLHH